MLLQLKQQIHDVWHDKNKFFYTHTNPDIDALTGTWIVFKYLKSSVSSAIELDDFIPKIKLLEEEDFNPQMGFGIDIGDGADYYYVKRVNLNVTFGGKVHHVLCSSAWLGLHLLTPYDFMIMEYFLSDVNALDNRGMNAIMQNVKSRDERQRMNIWKMLGSLSSNKNISTTEYFKTGLTMLDSLYYSNKEKYEALNYNLNDCQIFASNGLRLVILPVNAPKTLSHAAFNYLSADAILFSHYNKSSHKASIGIIFSRRREMTMVHKLMAEDEKFLKEFKAISQHDVVINAGSIGRFNKHPIKLDNENKLKELKKLIIYTFAMATTKLLVNEKNQKL